VSGILSSTGGEIRNGEIKFEGKDIKSIRTDQLVHLGMTLLPEGRRVFKNMTVRENLASYQDVLRSQEEEWLIVGYRLLVN